MGRPYVEFIHGFEISEERIEGVFMGASGRLLSADSDTGALTALLRVPAGAELKMDTGRLIELLCLRGAAEIESEQIEPGYYVEVPSSAPTTAIRAVHDCLLLAMADDQRGTGTAERVKTVDTNVMAWNHLRTGAGDSTGLVFKLVRVDADRGDWSYLVGCAPSWQEEKAERHPTVQEGFMIRGDLLNGRHGVMVPGTYFWRPPMVPHGPMATRNGAMFFFRTKGGSWEVTYETACAAADMVERYRSGEPYFAHRDFVM